LGAIQIYWQVILLITWLDFLKLLIHRLKEHRVTGLAAEQAYYYLLALFPLMILLLAILPYLSINSDTALKFLNNLAPSQTTKLIKNMIVPILSMRNSGLLTFGIVGTIWSAANGMNAFRISMNIALEVKEKRNFFIVHLVSIFLTFGLVFSIIFALILPVFGNTILDLVNHYLPISKNAQNFIKIGRWIIAIVVISMILSYLYYAAPCVHLPFRQVYVGAITATILWLVFSYGFSIYLGYFSHYSTTYGSLGGVIILILWLYLTGMAFIIGGEIIGVFHQLKTAFYSKTTFNDFLSQKNREKKSF
jgi:membrane protein